jgi:hypothetical protein
MKETTMCVDKDTEKREGERLGILMRASGISLDMPMPPFATWTFNIQAALH